VELIGTPDFLRLSAVFAEFLQVFCKLFATFLQLFCIVSAAFLQGYCSIFASSLLWRGVDMRLLRIDGERVERISTNYPYEPET
jgi:hypothetical protein